MEFSAKKKGFLYDYYLCSLRSKDLHHLFVEGGGGSFEEQSRRSL
jgi:hypothetical protein